MKKFFTIIMTMFIGNTTFAQDATVKYTSQNNADFAKTISDKNTQIVDVRTASEFASGHMPSALNMDINATEFDSQAAALDKNRPVALYCRSGGRSKIAAKRLSDIGFTAYELDRGFMNWNGEIAK